jgi:hypothetical protein
VESRSGDAWGMQRWAALSVAAGGTIALAGAGWFALAAHDKDVASRDHCSGNVCSPDGKAFRDDALSSGDRATALAIGGGVALVAGAVLWLTAPAKRSASTTAIGPRGITFGGVF